MFEQIKLSSIEESWFFKPFCADELGEDLEHSFFMNFKKDFKKDKTRENYLKSISVY